MDSSSHRLVICFFAETYRPVVSGTSLGLQRLVRELRGRGHESYVITAQYPGFIDTDDHVLRYRSVRLPQKFDIRLGIPSYKQLLERLRNIKPHLIHTQQPFLSGRVAQRIAEKIGIPLIGSIHTQYDHDQYLNYLYPLPKPVARYLVQRTITRFCNSCDVLITPAFGMRDHLRELNVRAPIEVVLSGIDTSMYIDAAHSQSNEYRESKENILLYVGRLTKEKNLGFLLDSFAQIHKVKTSVHLFIVGDGPERNRLETLSKKLGVHEEIKFMGWRTESEVASIYKQADVFVFPSITEVNPLCLIEAMASRVPIVAIDSYSSRQIVHHGENAILTKLDRDEFSSAILDLLDDSDKRTKMGLIGKEMSYEYTVSRHAERLLSIYQNTALAVEPYRI